MPERFTESEIQIAIGNILKRALDRKDNGGLQKTNNSEQQGSDEQDDDVQSDDEQYDDEKGDDEQDH